MTKKHFEALARAMRNCRPVGLGGGDIMHAQMYQWRLAVLNVADFCQDQNANFDKEKFLEKCGY